jgi:hypothetical protein
MVTTAALWSTQSCPQAGAGRALLVTATPHDSSRGMVKRGVGSGGVVAFLLLTGCGASPLIKATAHYREGALTQGRVLFVPLAVSQALGDRRTGIILSDETRALASDAACARLSSAGDDPAVVCWNQERAATEPTFAQVQSMFALDEPVPMNAWQSLRQSSGATHAVLFRPEAVGSSREVSQTERLGSPIVAVGFGGLAATSLLVSSLIAANNTRVETTNETELSYTVSASLVDLRTGKLLKVGLHSGSASRKVTRNLGFAEPPPAAPILEEVMSELGEVVLDD